MEVLLQDCTGAYYEIARRFFSSPNFGGFNPFLITWLYGGNHPDDGGILPSRKTILFDNILHLLHSGINCDLDHTCSILRKSRDGFWKFFPDYQTVRRHTTRLHGGGFEFGGFCPFFDYQTARGNHPDDGCFFPFRKPIVFNNIIKHLLHSCIQCDLDHSCSILHNSRDGFWPFFQTTRLYGGTLPNFTAAASNLWGFCPFFDYQTARGQPPWWWLLFSLPKTDPFQ